MCKLHLPAGGLHADLNGDGVLDHIQATGMIPTLLLMFITGYIADSAIFWLDSSQSNLRICDSGGSRGSSPHSDTSHHQFPGCYAYATSGIPPLEPLFNGSICRGGHLDKYSLMQGSEEGANRNIQVGNKVEMRLCDGNNRCRHQVD